MPELVIRKTRDIGDIITDTFSFIRVHIKMYALAVLYYVIPFLLISSIVVGVNYGKIFGLALDAESSVAPSGFEEELFGATGYFFVGIFITLISIGIMMVITYNLLKFASKDIPVESPSQLLDGVVMKMFGLLVINIITGILAGIGFLFFVIPGIYIAMRLTLASAIYVVDDLSIGEAISRSWEIVSGYWWTTFGIVIIMAIITNIISGVLTVPLLIFSVIAGAAGGAESSTFGAIVGVFYSLSITFSTIFACIPMISNTLHYFNLVERKEGSGLRNRIESLGL